MYEQYRLDLPQDQTVCNVQSAAVICNYTAPNEYHITQIRAAGKASPVGSPDPNLRSLYFPGLQQFFIMCSITGVPAIPTLNLLTLLKNMPNLTSIQTTNDLTINDIPMDFGQTLPSLKKLSILYSPLTTVDNFFNNTGIDTFVQWGRSIEKLRLDDSLRLPNLSFIQLEITPSQPQSWYITQNSFPKVYAVGFNSDGTALCNLKVDSSIIKEIFLLSSNSGGYNLEMVNTSAITQLGLDGKQSTLTPSDYNEYPNLQFVILTNSSISTYPFTSFPSSLLNFASTLSEFTEIPPIPIIKDNFFLGLANNKLTGSIPFHLWDNVIGGTLDVKNNPDLMGSVPESWCDKRLLLSNTSISYVPDCFWCYQSSNVISLPSTLTKPSSIDCAITLDKDIYFSMNGTANITGRNFGFYTENVNYRLIVSNSKIAITYLTIGTPQTVDINIFGTIIRPKVVVADIKVLDLQFSTPTNFYFSLAYNHFIDHQITLTSKTSGLQIPCSLSSPLTASGVSCVTPRAIIGDYILNITNQFNYYSMDLNLTYSYPVLNNVQLLDIQQQQLLLILQGNFGPSTLTVSVTLNNSMACTIVSKNSGLVECSLASIPSPGPATIQVSVQDFTVSFSDMLSIPYPPTTNLKQKCIDDTYHCYGHGQCSDQGICLCEPNYYDSCRYFKNPNVTFIQNNTKPVATFELDGYQFFFTLVSIQEIDTENEIVKELVVDQWNVTDRSNGDLTSLYYHLDINATLHPGLSASTNVSTSIEYSTKDREVAFGDSVLSVSANSIKVAVNISGWQYDSILSHLRVVFATVVNNDDQQSVTPTCDDDDSDGTIPTFEEVFGGNSYLRVIKNNTQFYGRFLSYSYSDGRKTYSKNELISKTPINGSTGTTDGGLSLAKIGIHFAQCDLCLLDPDFSALVVNNKQLEVECPTSSSVPWKIIVGACVGGVVFIAFTIALVYYIRDSNRMRLRLREIFQRGGGGGGSKSTSKHQIKLANLD
ncbi:hypothetical protein DFA_00648 [Cavenderia fasciculata]|uniref:ComC supersandwich domain-containing protein n=1 Tax=Cavenderia fasciculata TaxID=261658 RepID=F4PSZ4_CACFS|nr:uncharacterized protein DFA_00648 [Cavenderia fasciculata]EGG20783.1 hypothetical protein DFA_00648 [Cavenderia fasciculata]|eukprot:XP_004358633.1 hypothetical protein DFA_00648 [Cavenderia fasciculata]